MTMARWSAWVVVVAACGGEGIAAGPPPGTLPASCPANHGAICTVAGTGVAGDGADGQAPLATMLYAPTDMAFAPNGALYIVDWNNHRIRGVQSNGQLKIVAGAGELSPDLGDDDVAVRLNHPTDITFDRQGRLVIAAWHNSRIKRVDVTTGVLEDIAGTGGRSYGGDGGPALAAILNLPVSVVYDAAENLYLSDQANQRIRCIDTMGMIRTVVGTGDPGFEGDGGPATAAKVNLPVGQKGHPAGHITRDAAGNMYLADTLNNRIRRIDAAGIVTTVAGNGELGSLGEGSNAIEAQLNHPVDVALGPEGALYIADTENDCVRKVQDGTISTVAGQCGSCATAGNAACNCLATDAACIGDGSSASAAHLKLPSGIAFDTAGNLFIADTLHHRIRVVVR